MSCIVKINIAQIYAATNDVKILDDVQLYFYNAIKYSPGVVKLLFNVFALYASDPTTYRSLALTCRAGRDVCREFAALKKFAFRRIVYMPEKGIYVPGNDVNEIVYQRYMFNLQGLEFGARSHREGSRYTACVENGEEKYLIYSGRRASKFTSILDGTRGFRMISGDFMFSGIGTEVIEINNLKTHKGIHIFKCMWCGRINQIRLIQNVKNAPVLYRLCRVGRRPGEWKFYQGDYNARPMSLACKILQVYYENPIAFDAMLRHARNM